MKLIHCWYIATTIITNITAKPHTEKHLWIAWITNSFDIRPFPSSVHCYTLNYIQHIFFVGCDFLYDGLGYTFKFINQTKQCDLQSKFRKESLLWSLLSYWALDLRCMNFIIFPLTKTMFIILFLLLLPLLAVIFLAFSCSLPLFFSFPLFQYRSPTLSVFLCLSPPPLPSIRLHHIGILRKFVCTIGMTMKMSNCNQFIFMWHGYSKMMFVWHFVLLSFTSNHILAILCYNNFPFRLDVFDCVGVLFPFIFFFYFLYCTCYIRFGVSHTNYRKQNRGRNLESRTVFIRQTVT